MRMIMSFGAGVACMTLLGPLGMAFMWLGACIDNVRLALKGDRPAHAAEPLKFKLGPWMWGLMTIDGIGIALVFNKLWDKNGADLHPVVTLLLVWTAVIFVWMVLVLWTEKLIRNRYRTHPHKPHYHHPNHH
jgi:hypothetical protein